MMKCLYCKREMVKGKAPFHADRKGYHVFWEGIPAWVCPQCGEAFFEEEAVEEIQNALKVLDKSSPRLTAKTGC